MPKYHVQVWETTTADAAGSGEHARELLPWADPYIAALMGRLESEDSGEDEAWDFAAKFDESDEDTLLEDVSDEDWHLDREPSVPPVYGGWPLLNDVVVES